jgi:hypothetical protein
MSTIWNAIAAHSCPNFFMDFQLLYRYQVYFYSWYCYWMLDLLTYLFTVLRPIKNFLLIWRCHHCRWRASKFWPMLGAQGLWVGRDLYRATPAVTWDVGFYDLIWRTAPFSRLLQHTRGCGGSILTWILMALFQHWKLGGGGGGGCKFMEN